jgi:hypothetical protein
MPDTGNVPSPNSLYPQPPAPPQPGNSLATMNPLQVLGLAQGITQLQGARADLASRQASGAAYQGSLNDDGTVDLTKLSSALRNNPDAAYGMPEAVSRMIEQRGAQQLQNMQRQKFLADSFSVIDPAKPTEEQVHNWTAMTARNNPDIPASVIAGMAQSALSDPKGLAHGVGVMRNMALGAAGTSERTEGPPDATTGAPTTISKGEANLAQGGIPKGLPPGDAAVLEANKKSFTEDQERSASTQANLRKLETAYPLIQSLGNSNFGPGSAEFAKLKGALTTAGVIDPSTSDLQVRQEAGKYLLNYAQGAQTAGRSDHALTTAIGSNPNLDLTQPANLALIRNQIGMDKADAAIPVLFHQQHPNANDKASYNDFKANFYRNYDPRAFTYDKMAPEERRDLIDSLGAKGSPAYQKFAKTYDQLKKSNFVTPNAQ